MIDMISGSHASFHTNPLTFHSPFTAAGLEPTAAASSVLTVVGCAELMVREFTETSSGPLRCNFTERVLLALTEPQVSTSCNCSSLIHVYNSALLEKQHVRGHVLKRLFQLEINEVLGKSKCSIIVLGRNINNKE